MRRRWWWILAVVVIVGAPVAWYLGSPLLLNKVVDEAAVGGSSELRGTFAGADDFHQGSGTAVIVRTGAQRILRFEEFRVTNGPDLYVYLAEHAQPRSRQDVAQGYVSLGKLKGNVGGQNYEIPPGTDLAKYHSVVIYCQPFHVVFATATFEAAQ